MPAQWPIFINNLSQKLASRTSKGPDDIGMFVANEYFNAVKTAQTPFGNIHKPGQKPILEEGFKKAFNILFESLEPKLEDKFGNPIYDDMLERLPGIDLSTNPECEFEEWTIKNKETIDPFEFYPLFPTTCIIPKPIIPETNLFGEIDITSENIENQPELRYVTMSVIGGDGTFPYEFTYSLNGLIQPELTSDSSGIVRFLAPTDPGKYEYTFISAVDASKKAEIKNIDRSASIEIKEDSKAVEIKVDPLKVHQLVKPMTEAQQIDEIVNRVYYQNDGSEKYLDWVKRLQYHGAFAKKVSKKVLDILDKESVLIKTNNRVNKLSPSRPNLIKFKNNLQIKKKIDINDRLFQEEYIDRPDSLPKFITAKFICIFSYVAGIDDNQKGAPNKNSVIAVTTPAISQGYNSISIGNNSKPETYEEWIKKTEPARLKLKLKRYDIEKVRYRELKIRYINQLAEDNKKAGNACGADDAYCVMSKCILDYWKSTGAQPFATSPPILPCLIPQPGSYIPVYYGDESKLGADLRRAWNTGKRFKIEPTLQTATRAVATAVAVSCAKHLKDLKFIYNGKIPSGSGTAPMIGFSLIAF
jgi:hypothetical protein